jgi:HIRAN domain-containing protein
LSANLFLAWQDPGTRTWHTFARLRKNGDDYELAFTRGAQRLGTIPLELFKLDITKIYRFGELIPVFRNRLPSRKRADFERMAAWLNLTGDEDEFTQLGRFGLIPGTDSILIYPEPEIIRAKYHLEFFVHGIRHMHKDAPKICDSTNKGERLLPLLDVQNPVDQNAVALRREDDPTLIGYVPTFYAADIKILLSSPGVESSARFTVVRSNKDAPMQLRLLCRFESAAPAQFHPLDTEAHMLLKKEAPAELAV